MCLYSDIYSDQLVKHRKIKNSLRLSEYSVQLKETWSSVSFTYVPFRDVTFKVELCTGIHTHFCLKWPMNSCNPMRAKTLKQKTVRIITSASFFTDWNNAPTMVFRPARYSITCYSKKSIKRLKADVYECYRVIPVSSFFERALITWLDNGHARKI